MGKKAITILFGILILSFLGSCGYDHGNYRNHKADDLLSKSVYEALGDDVYYLSKDEVNGEIRYYYFLNKSEGTVFNSFVTAINQAVSDNQEKMRVSLCSPIPGGDEVHMHMTNYSDRKLEYADYDGFKNIYVIYHEDTLDKLFLDPVTYVDLPDVHIFSIDERLHEKAVEQGIDWHQIWPDLEELEIRDTTK